MYYDSMPRQFKDITRHASYSSALSGPQKEMVCILKDMIESVGAELPTPARKTLSKDRNGTFTTTTWQSVLNFFFKREKSGEASDHDSCSSDEVQAARDGVNSERTIQNNVLPDVLWFGTKVRHQGQVRIFLAAVRSMADTGEYADRKYLPTITEEGNSANNNQLTFKTTATGIASVMRVSMISFVPVSSHAVAASTSEHPLNPIAHLL